MNQITILWADDEIDLLKPQILFLEKKGYKVITVSNGYDAIEELENTDNQIDVIFLDENMPGLSGIDTLERMKLIAGQIPFVMITKNEEEGLMEQAIGSNISDYLIKPVNPIQILSTLVKLVDGDRLVQEETGMKYQQEVRNIFNEINNSMSAQEWVETYKKIVHWELKLDESKITNMSEILIGQKETANSEFAKFISKNYMQWIDHKSDPPVLSHDLLRSMVFPDVKDDKLTVFVIIDNLRWDQWKMIEPIISKLYRVEEEECFFSILPTTTQYSRNAIFAGMMPADIDSKYGDWWFNDNEKGGKNLHEKDLLGEQIKRVFRKPIKFDYIKVTNAEHGKNLADNILNYKHNNFLCIVYNFMDMLSHARTEMEILKELAGDEKAYRSLTASWFEHSPLWDALKTLSEIPQLQLFLGTDHGSIRVHEPVKVVADRETTTNLRYKVGKNLAYDKKDVFEIRNPAEAKLPKPNISSSYIFAKSDQFFVYPNNYNQFNNFYKNTFQHGGISLEEVIVPIIKLKSK